MALDRTWTDEDGEPLGGWVEIPQHEWRHLLTGFGGLEALAVFSTLTDPEGCYGEPCIYTSWGRREDDAPLLDCRLLNFKNGARCAETIGVYRKFEKLARTATEEGE